MIRVPALLALSVLLGVQSAALPALAAAPSASAASTAYPSASTSPLSIANERAREYPGSALTVRQTLAPGSNYTRQVVSYQSDGLRINALLTVPRGTPPKGGWPTIVFNHGYIPPKEYRTTERYVAYQDAFARAGFITLKSDYRGHGSSEGEALGGYFDPGYTTDVLNAAASLRKDPRVNAARLGVWGHSMGGHLSLRAMVVEPTWFKAAAIWAGVVAPYDLIFTGWHRGPGAERVAPTRINRRAELVAKYGTPAQDPAFWSAVSPNSYLASLKGIPFQLQQGTADVEVPVSFMRALQQGLDAQGIQNTFYLYPGDNHNISRNLSTALARSVAFFKANL